MTGLEQASAILDTVKYLDGIAALEHDQFAAADKKCGPSVRWVNLESPVSPKAFIMNIVHQYTRDAAISAWVDDIIDKLDCQTTHLTHLDLFPTNIMSDKHTKSFITLIDWEMSGFYLRWYFVVECTAYSKHPFTRRVLNQILREMDKETAFWARKLASLFHHLRLAFQPLRDPVERLNVRDSNWAKIRESIGSEVSVEPPEFDYTKLDLRFGSTRTNHYRWREFKLS